MRKLASDYFKQKHIGKKKSILTKRASISLLYFPGENEIIFIKAHDFKHNSWYYVVRVVTNFYTTESVTVIAKYG